MLYEVITSPVIQEQLQLYKYKGFDAQAYRFNRLTNYCGKFIHHCGWYPDQKIRLWKNGVGHWEGHIHEELILQSSVQVKTMNGDILHYVITSYSIHYTKLYESIPPKPAALSGFRTGTDNGLSKRQYSTKPDGTAHFWRYWRIGQPSRQHGQHLSSRHRPYRPIHPSVSVHLPIGCRFRCCQTAKSRFVGCRCHSPKSHTGLPGTCGT